MKRERQIIIWGKEQKIPLDSTSQFLKSYTAIRYDNSCQCKRMVADLYVHDLEQLEDTAVIICSPALPFHPLKGILYLQSKIYACECRRISCHIKIKKIYGQTEDLHDLSSVLNSYWNKHMRTFACRKLFRYMYLLGSPCSLALLFYAMRTGRFLLAIILASNIWLLANFYDISRNVV